MPLGTFVVKCRMPQVLVFHLGLLTVLFLVNVFRRLATSTYPVSLRVKVVRGGRLNAPNGCMLLVIRHPAAEVTP
jgi:hypothetical protein